MANEVVVYEPKSLLVLERMVRRRLLWRLRAFAAGLPFAQEVLRFRASPSTSAPSTGCARGCS